VVRFFSGANPLNILVLFILGALFRLPLFLSGPLPDSFQDAGLGYLWVNEFILGSLRSNPWGMYAIAYLILFIQSVSLNGFINNQKLFPSAHLLFAYFYLLFSSLLPSWNWISPFFLFNSIFVLILPRMVRLYQQYHPQNDLFILGVLGGVGSLLHISAWLLLPWLLIALLLLRPFRVAEFVILLVGFLLPNYFALSYCYLSNQFDQARLLLPHCKFALPLFKPIFESWAIGILILIPVIFGGVNIANYLFRMLALPRKVWGLIFYALLIAILFLFMDKGKSEDTMVVLLLPASFFMAAFAFFPSNKFFPSLWAWLTIAFMVAWNFL
jgi:hypothetical protein